MRKTLDRYVKIIYILGLLVANKYLSTEQNLVVVNVTEQPSPLCFQLGLGVSHSCQGAVTSLVQAGCAAE